MQLPICIQRFLARLIVAFVAVCVLSGAAG